MNLAERIESAEIKYRQNLENYFNRIWRETILFSHDLDHHRRVWQYTKELLKETDISGEIISPALPEKLLIASFLHDLGMSIDPGIRHGSHSHELCKSFLEKTNLDKSEYSDVLEAVKHHDDKEYQSHLFNSNETLRILAVADDLDAFGYTGIYRYLDIYLARGIRQEVIGYEIRKNAFSRYKNFDSVFGIFPGLIEKHRKRYLLLDKFFSEFNHQIEDSSNSNVQRDYIITVETISGLIRNKIHPGNMELKHMGSADNSIYRNFIIQLSTELNASGNGV